MYEKFKHNYVHNQRWLCLLYVVALLPPFYHFGDAFRPQIVKVGALSAPTEEMLLKYCLDLSYIQNGSYLFLLFVKT